MSNLRWVKLTPEQRFRRAMHALKRIQGEGDGPSKPDRKKQKQARKSRQTNRRK